MLGNTARDAAGKARSFCREVGRTLPPLSCLRASSEEEGGPGRKGQGLPVFAIHDNLPEAFPPLAKLPPFTADTGPRATATKERGVRYNSARLQPPLVHKSEAEKERRRRAACAG